MVIDDTGSVEDIHAFIHCKKWRSGQVSPMPDWLTDSLTTLKDRATQLLIKYKSGAFVTQLHSTYSTALSCLADVSDALRYSGDDFDDEGVQNVKEFCEEWGKIWPVLFPIRNITPKGHILAFVLPKVVEQHRTFFRFYKVEEKGESIHATMNDINRKCWVIKNKEARLWKIIERYELRNVTNIEKD